jgi:hypothetical protein
MTTQEGGEMQDLRQKSALENFFPFPVPNRLTAYFKLGFQNDTGGM